MVAESGETVHSEPRLCSASLLSPCFLLGFVLLTKPWDTSDFRPREHVFLSENDMPLVEHETTLSGYGREVRQVHCLNLGPSAMICPVFAGIALIWLSTDNDINVVCAETEGLDEGACHV